MKYLGYTLAILSALGCNLHHNKEFDSRLRKETFHISSPKVESLFVLGKVWGFLKYYHPNVAKGELNWDYELFNILPEINNCRSKAQRNKVLLKWIKALGTIDERKNENPDTTHIKLYPDLDWLKDTLELGSNLSEALLNIENSKRNDYNYYVSLVPKIGNPQFENEKSYDSVYNPNTNFKLLTLFRYWNIINYFYPYKYLIGSNWDSVLAVFIPKFESDTNNLSYRLTTLELISTIHDSHANIYNDSIMDKYWGKYQVPIHVRFIENKLVVTGLISIKGERNIFLDTGDVILSVNNKSIDEIVKERLPLTPASNYPTQLRNISAKILRTNDTVIKVTYQREGAVSATELKCYPYNNAWHMEEIQRKDTCFKYLTPDITYIYPGNIKLNYVPAIMQYCMSSKEIIIDLRCYPSESILYAIGVYLMPSIPFAKFTNGSITNPGLFYFTQTASVGGNNNYYRGKIVILVNELTQSQAEFTAMAFRVAPKATVIGSTTAGADGTVSFFYLPGGIKTAITGIGVYNVDGKETQRVGIVPKTFVLPTIMGIKERRDELLEMAVAAGEMYGY